MTKSVDKEIVERHNAIENALNHPEIQQKLKGVSYDRKELLQGKALNEAVRMSQTIKRDQYGSQASSTDFLLDNLKETKEVYRDHITLARLAFKGNRGMNTVLELSGGRQRSTDAWLAQAANFYEKSDEIAGPMAKYGVTPEGLQQAKAMVEAITTARQQQQLRRGDAQNATQQRDAARRAMNKWMVDFRAAARVALKDNPQLLEALGMLVRSKVK